MVKIKNIIICMMFIILLSISFLSAYDPKEVNQNLSFSITSNNATGCNITTLEQKELTNLNYIMTKSGQTFSATIDQGNFTETGNACFNLECFDGASRTTGDECFSITPNGEIASIGSAIFYIGLLIVLVIFLVGCVTIFMETDNLLAKVGTFGMGYLILMAIMFISWNMAGDFLTSSTFLVSMFRILFFVMIIGIFPLLLGSFTWYFIMLFKIKEIERLMSKGFSEDEARRRTR